MLSLKVTTFSTQPQCCLTFSRIELQMFLKCCLTHNHHYIETHFAFSIFMPMRLILGLFMLYLYDVFVFFSLIFSIINHIISLKQTHLLLINCLGYFWMIKWMKKANNFNLANVQPHSVA